MTRLFRAVATSLLLLLTSVPALRAQDWEVWVVDQADAVNGGDRLYIYTPASWDRPAHTVQLDQAAGGVGDGAGTRPHLLLFNNTHSHGILANVGSGHVYIIRGSDRTVVASIDVGVQAHGAMASPDDRWILVANQNGKRLARIAADFPNERFAWQPEADLDLAALEDEGHPDNAPICPVMYVGGSGKAYVTLRGGGMYVVDTLATPMQVIRSYSSDEIAPAGCGGLVAGGMVFVNSGSATSGDVYIFDPVTDDLIAHMPTAHLGTDPHGMALIRNRYLWMANRAVGDNIVIWDVRNQQLVGTIDDVGAAPDLMDVSPDGNLVFVTLRGPKPLTGGGAAIGATPGVAVIQVERNGAGGRRIAFIPIGSQAADSDADPHGIAVRWP
jgi:DNA-binding beta-propeller fold protein YncE